MSMDWKEAKALSLEVWDFFRNHPECTYKKDLPSKLWNKIRLMKGYCPLCEYFNGDCSNCPLRFCYDVYGNLSSLSELTFDPMAIFFSESFQIGVVFVFVLVSVQKTSVLLSLVK